MRCSRSRSDFAVARDSCLDWLRALIITPIIVQGITYINNLLRRLFAPRKNQRVIINIENGLPVFFFSLVPPDLTASTRLISRPSRSPSTLLPSSFSPPSHLHCQRHPHTYHVLHLCSCLSSSVYMTGRFKVECVLLSAVSGLGFM